LTTKRISKMNFKTIITAAMLTLTPVFAFAQEAPVTAPADCITAEYLADKWAADGAKLYTFTPEELNISAPAGVVSLGVYSDGQNVVIVPFKADGCASEAVPPLVTTITEFQQNSGVVLQ
jgi:hypothetical protein